MTKLRIYTCTPQPFQGDETFFARDSGMFCRGLQEAGVNSKAIMPGPTADSDLSDLIRTDYHNLESLAWWKSLNLDGLVLYSWASPGYNKIAKAVQAAQIPFVVAMDTCGLISRQANGLEWWRASWERTLPSKNWPYQTLKQLTDGISSFTAKRRVEHYRLATAVTVPTPLGALWVRQEAKALGIPHLEDRITYLPHPQSSLFKYDTTAKEGLVITVARWQKEDWPQKNPRVLIETYRRFLVARPRWKGLIIGRGATLLIKQLGFQEVPGLDFVEQMSTQDLCEVMNTARIGFWSSRWEGQQGTAAQALCCGCSVVSHSSPHMSCFRHYVTQASGRLATRNHPDALADELILEADSWENGRRDPQSISAFWCKEFHAINVASQAMALLGYSS